MPRKEGEGFGEWLDWILREAEVYDYGRYPVKGCGVWMPYGFAIRRNVLDIVRRALDSTGHEEILLPMLIPEDMLSKEAEHIRGFSDQVLWVTHGGLDPLDVKLALRPTSETCLTYMESLWFSSYKDLPKKFYQVVSIFRYETKATRPMLRLREVTTFKEAHTAHESFEDAERQVFEAVGIYSRVFSELGVPFVISKRPDWDKFAGALYTIAFDTILPDGRVLQVGTVHHLGQSFSKVFDAKVQLRNGELDYVWQTSYGMSDRVIATVIAVHGDDKGLMLPFKVAPIQVVVVPIPAKSDEDNKMVRAYSSRVFNELVSCGLRAKLDDREEYTPGWKYNYWELKGVPIRAECGLREVETETVTLARRDTRQRLTIPLANACSAVLELGKAIDESLARRAASFFNEHRSRAGTLDEARRVLQTKKGIVELPWCGKEPCGKAMEEALDARCLGTPVDTPELEGDTCPVCGRRAVTLARFGKTY